MYSSVTSPSGLNKNKFDLKNPRKNLQIVEDNFFKWSNDHMYRTSTHDMQDKVINLVPRLKRETERGFRTQYQNNLPFFNM